MYTRFSETKTSSFTLFLRTLCTDPVNRSERVSLGCSFGGSVLPHEMYALEPVPTTIGSLSAVCLYRFSLRPLWRSSEETCQVKSAVSKVHDWVVYKFGGFLGSVGHRVKIHKITPVTGKERGDLELKDYVVVYSDTRFHFEPYAFWTIKFTPYWITYVHKVFRWCF